MTDPLPPNAAPWPEGREPTLFPRAVIDAVAALQPGELISYGDVAEEIGRPGSGQAVANVLRSAPDLPWWRVLPAGGRVGSVALTDRRRVLRDTRVNGLASDHSRQFGERSGNGEA